MGKKTTDQHFVPQVYLRGFSLEYRPLNKSLVHKDKHTIFAFDLGKKKYDSNNSIPIKSICSEKNLYEIYNIEGKIIFPNWLENFFKALEKMYGVYRTQLEEKVRRENIGNNAFLSNKEKNFWITFIAIHLLRNYYALSAAEEAVRQIYSENVPDKEIKSFIRKYCLPFFIEIKEDAPETRILAAIMNPMYTMNFAVGVDYNDQLITSDKGVTIISSEGFPTEEYEEVIFPITSSICLFLFGKDNKDKHSDNSLFELSDAGKKHVMANVVLDAYQKVYSNHRFSIEEKRFIKELCMERNKNNSGGQY